MTQEEKQLLFKDLCARLPYKVICTASVRSNNTDTPSIPSNYCLTHSLLNYVWIDCYKLRPYLRPMSNMTEEEHRELSRLVNDDNLLTGEPATTVCLHCGVVIDFHNSHHLDWRGLIEKGLAIEAPEDMYNTKTK